MLDDDRRPVFRWRPRRVWWSFFALFLLMSSAWSLTVPLFGAPDEPAHVVKAAAVARGQLTGRSVPGASGLLVVVRVPEVFASSLKIFDCYTWHLHTTPACAPPFRGSRRPAEMATPSGRYNPLYYSLVGIPLRVWPSAFGVYLARIVTGALGAAFLASAVLSTLLLGRSRLAVAGAAVAVTPMVIFLNGSVNPNALEDCAALSVWCTGLALATRHEPVDRRLLLRFCVASVVLVNTRPFSLVWYGLAVLSMLTLAGWSRMAALARDRAVRIGAGAVALSGLAAAAWVLGPGRARGPKPAVVADDVFRQAIARGDTLVQQMVGRFGWLDVPGPSAVYVVWIFAVGFLLLGALVVGRPRARFVLVALVGATVVLPVAFELWQTRAVGGAWQGRYTLPLAVGIPVVAGMTLGADLRISEAARVRRMIFALFVSAHIVSYAWVARHYAIGSSGPLDYIGNARWHPPVSLLLQLLVFAGSAVGLAVLMYRVSAPRAASHDDADGIDEHPATEAVPREGLAVTAGRTE